ncbi:uncharacterized protein L3040_002671 [Drepanopeziza brunnea f. sp. 'multigermtubi']|uniref:UBX domain-containing protein n=1 Tax=Marssonina brunnea f. sp. multigermtubi (strain MB_m1) TaxID=1072389 RepID=K1X2J5_MARBU|nr:UBX domain-containing protein [Drepanopeziza brunnea f. sp. 'multigermtubi' MB_m1]EKD19451.1 UBX domain-containing protein [Drepanopeziza brunnea f. sp. 'multigermtubi' MB_m1]KAJ5050802.1 hypothetical protein L3040_002671 [Drepanopeziza brunnea f. sp. 'multigermtubi']
MADPELMEERLTHSAAITQFIQITNAQIDAAETCLRAYGWDLDQAVTGWFEQNEPEAEAGEDTEMAGAEPKQEEYTGPRTLDGRPAPQSIPAVGSSSSSAKPKKKGGIATLGSLSSGSHGHGHDDDDDEDDEDFDPDGEPRDLFAGGEKSGLAVQDPPSRSNDPRKVVSDILKKAKANAARPGGGPSSSAAAPSRFRGSGMTLGGEDTPSQVIPDPHPQAPEVGETQTRILHLWTDGFSVEDGPLHRFDDPQNAADLQMIRTGRAPLHLMGVRPDQPVDVQLIKHNEAYKAPPKVYKPFSGSGNRLGSPTPGASTTSTAPAAAPTAASSNVGPVAPAIDDSQPTVTLRIQLASGTRLTARFNTTNTIGDIYDFVNSAARENNERDWVLATTFPNKDHTDKSLVLGEMAEFKRGGNAVQKWT